jgi:hypothetical protein
MIVKMNWNCINCVAGLMNYKEGAELYLYPQGWFLIHDPGSSSGPTKESYCVACSAILFLCKYMCRNCLLIFCRRRNRLSPTEDIPNDREFKARYRFTKVPWYHILILYRYVPTLMPFALLCWILVVISGATWQLIAGKWIQICVSIKLQIMICLG